LKRSLYNGLFDRVGSKYIKERNPFMVTIIISQIVGVIGNWVFLLCTNCTTITRKESLNLLSNEKLSIRLKTFRRYQWYWLLSSGWP
jgi:hypothetical protein